MIWIQKDRVDNYRVYVTLHRRMMCVNELDKTAYNFFLEYLKQMSFSLRLPFQYYFPTYAPMPDVRIMIVKSKENYYNVSLNLGAIYLSEMDQSEFDFLIGKLEGLTSSDAPIGTKIYFQPVRDIFNDK